jgi:hypothetical protein
MALNKIHGWWMRTVLEPIRGWTLCNCSCYRCVYKGMEYDDKHCKNCYADSNLEEIPHFWDREE